MDNNTKNALYIEARKLALDANRLCLSLKDAGADETVRLKAGEAYGLLCSVWHAFLYNGD